MSRKMKEGRLFIGIRKGRHRLRWMDDVVADRKVMKIKRWMEMMNDREKWRLIGEEAKDRPGLQRREEGRKDYLLSRDKQFQKVAYTNIIQIVNEM